MQAPKVSYVRFCTLHRVIDGDTIELLVDLGFKRFSREIVRLAYINAPEAFGEQKLHGDASTGFVRNWFDPAGQYILDSHKKDSFGRWLGDVWRVDTTPHRNLASDLLLYDFAEAWPNPGK